MAVKFPPPSPPFIRARNQGGRQTPKALVLHGTVSSDNKGTARNIALWWKGPTSPVSSAHYVVDPSEIIQCVGDHNIAYHCGYNTGSIGIEFCDEQQGPPSRWNDADSNAILKRAARLTAELCLAYDISPHRPTIAQLRAKGPHGIYGHNDSRLAFGNTTHTDPRDFPWDKFLTMVRAEIQAIRAEVEAKPPKTFKVLHAPLHGASATRKEIRKALRRRKRGVVSIAFSEAWRQSAWLSKLKHWRTTTGLPGNVDDRGRQVEREVVLLTRKYRNNIESGTFKIADEAAPLKIAPERYLSYSVDNVHGESLAVIALHPHAAVRGAWDTDRAKEFRQSMQALAGLIKHLREKHPGIDIVVLGDLNYPDVSDDRTWTPGAVFDRLGFKSVVRGIDWVAYSKGLKKVSVRVTRDNGQDHPWIEVEFSR